MTESETQEQKNQRLPRRSFLKLLFTRFAALSVVILLLAALFKKFLYPSTSYQKSKAFRAGFPIDYHPGKVDERYKGTCGVFIVRSSPEEGNYLFALSARCTHLGCMVNYNRLGDEFVCPCHGSRYKKDGVNFSGPATRPLDLVSISFGEDGSIMIDADRVHRRKSATEKVTEKDGFYLAL
jgi:cytochrome b6-f complex iron-sulfur subunit